jgi:serine protease
VNSALTPAQSIMLLKSSAAAFPATGTVGTCHVPISADDIQNTECSCTVGTCGAGMLDTGAAVAAAIRPFGVLSVIGTVASGGNVTATAAGSFASNGHSISRYEWTVANLTGTAPVVLSPAQPETTVQITGTSEFTLRLTLTDDAGAQDTKEVVLATPPPPVVTTPPAVPAAASASRGGGGQLGWELLLLVGVPLMRRRFGSTSPASHRSPDGRG